MPTVDIYHGETRIASRKFKTDFMIVAEVADQKVIRWEVDEESASERGGVILAWLRASGYPPEVHFVPPGWSLSVDGLSIIGASDDISPESRFDIPIKGKIAELRHDDMSFVFQFSSDAVEQMH